MATATSSEKPKATLEDLDPFEVSIVTRAANKRKFLLFKSEDTDMGQDLEKAATKRENGEDFPAEAFAFVPDPDKPSTWKLRLWDSLAEKETARQVGRAIAALGKGFRGRKVQIPSDQLAKVKAKVRAAWRKTHPDTPDSEMPEVIRKDSNGDLFIKEYTQMNENLIKALEAELQNEGEVDSVLKEAGYSEEAAEVFKGILRIFGSFRDKFGEANPLEPLAKLAGLELPVKEVVKEVSKEDKEKIQKEDLLAKLSDEDRAKLEQVFKRQDELEEEAKRAAEIAKAERELRLQKEYLQKAEEFSNLTIEKDKMANVLRKIDESLNEEDAEEVRRALKAAAEAAEAENLFKAAGTPGGSTSSVEEKINTLAKEMVQKGEAKDINAAWTKILSANPDLYKEYLAEKPLS